MFARTPPPPYCAVIFSSVRTPGDTGYDAMAQRMAELAAQQPGYLGAESVRNAEGEGITVSYWTDEAAATAWASRSARRSMPAPNTSMSM